MADSDDRGIWRVTAYLASYQSNLVAARKPILASALLVFFALLQPPGLEAQGIPLSQILVGLFGDEIVLAAGRHEGHFKCAECRGAADALNQSLVSQLASSPPVNSSAGGFTYEYDPVAGTYERTSDSFGPIFAERPSTLGKGRFNYGVSAIHFEYDSLDGVSLTDGALAFDLSHEDVEADGGVLDAFFEGDLVEAKTFLDLRSDTTTFFFNWGVTDRIDLALVVPWVQVELDARVDATVRDLATAGHQAADGSLQPIHQFAGGVNQKTITSGGSASGIGDVILRGKYNFAKKEGHAMSAAAELRLPTGDDADLLGIGETQVKLFAIGAMKVGPVSPHANLGFTLSTGDLPDELNLAAGFDAAIHPRVTVAMDLLSRTLFDANQLRRTEEDHFFRQCTPPGGTPCVGFGPGVSNLPIGVATRRSLEVGKSDQSLVYGSLGFKFNPWKNLLITANLLYSLRSDGLQDEDVIPLLGVDYSF